MKEFQNIFKKETWISTKKEKEKKETWILCWDAIYIMNAACKIH